MPTDPETIARHVDATAALIGLPIAPAQRAEVLRYFALAAGMAEIVNAVPLTAADEPAEAFVPISPAARERA